MSWPGAAMMGEEGIAGRLEFCTGDVRKLDFSDDSFDALVAHTLLSHIEGPLSVLKEAARVVRPGGTGGIFVSALVTNPRVMRQLPRLMRAAGIEACRKLVRHAAGETKE